MRYWKYIESMPPDPDGGGWTSRIKCLTCGEVFEVPGGRQTWGPDAEDRDAACPECGATGIPKITADDCPIGRVFGTWKVIGRLKRKGDSRWEVFAPCKCVYCGLGKTLPVAYLGDAAAEDPLHECGRHMSPDLIVGLKVGRWTVLGNAPSRNGQRYLECRCDCGTVRAVQRQTLIDGRSRSCGRCQTNTGRGKAMPDGRLEVGSVVGPWTVTHVDEDRRSPNRSRYVRAKCICGNPDEIECVASELKDRHSGGCGKCKERGFLYVIRPDPTHRSMVLDAAKRENLTAVDLTAETRPVLYSPMKG